MKRIFFMVFCFFAVFGIVLPVSAFELGVWGSYPKEFLSLSIAIDKSLS